MGWLASGEKPNLKKTLGDAIGAGFAGGAVGAYGAWMTGGTSILVGFGLGFLGGLLGTTGSAAGKGPSKRS